LSTMQIVNVILLATQSASVNATCNSIIWSNEITNWIIHKIYNSVEKLRTLLATGSPPLCLNNQNQMSKHVLCN